MLVGNKGFLVFVHLITKWQRVLYTTFCKRGKLDPTCCLWTPSLCSCCCTAPPKVMHTEGNLELGESLHLTKPTKANIQASRGLIQKLKGNCPWTFRISETSTFPRLNKRVNRALKWPDLLSSVMRRERPFEINNCFVVSFLEKLSLLAFIQLFNVTA